MDGQGLQAIRGEIEAIVTFQAALNRLALHVEENALSEWNGPRPEDVDGMAEDDGTFSRSELADVRKKAGEALAVRFQEVAAVVARHPELQSLFGRALAAGTGGVANLVGPDPGSVLAALSRTGSIRLDWAQAAANLVREELVSPAPAMGAEPVAAVPASVPAKKPAAPKPAAKKAAAKKTAAKKPAPKKAAAKKPAPKKEAAKKPAPKKAAARKPAAKKKTPAKKKPAPKKKPAARRR
jgi:hypothetical protein